MHLLHFHDTLKTGVLWHKIQLILLPYLDDINRIILFTQVALTLTETLSFSAAFLLGLLGGVHCIGMCGGIMSALSFSISQQTHGKGAQFTILLSYNLGRLLSYSIIGALIGALAWLAKGQVQQLGFILRLLSGVMLIAMGLYLARWWLGLSYLEKFGSLLWQRIQPIGNRLMPVNSTPQALILGAIWGWLPCGLVYSAATWAATSADWKQSALIMLAFGLGTLPVMLLTGQFAHYLQSFIQSNYSKRIAAILIIAFGLWTLAGTVNYALPGMDHSAHIHHAQPDEMSDHNNHSTMDHAMPADADQHPHDM